MRINIYGEELTDDFEVVEKHIEDTGNDYVGVRFFLKSPPELHYDENDDDRTAVTFWAKKENLMELTDLFTDVVVQLDRKVSQ